MPRSDASPLRNMKPWRPFLFALALAVFLVSCQTASWTVTLLADGRTYALTASSRRTAGDLLAEAGVTAGPDDRLLYLGSPVALDAPLLRSNSGTLVLRRALTLTVVTPDGTQTLRTSAQTVGQALAEAGFSLDAADRIDPPAGTPLGADGATPLTVRYRPGTDLIVTADGAELRVSSAAASVGQALAEAGIPLVGLDYSVPPEDGPLPADGRVQVVRVAESIAITQKPIPFNTRTELSADLEIDQQALLQGGEPGLAITRVRSRSEDGVQVAQQSEGESIVRPPQDRILGFGTKIVIRTTVVDGVTIEYWRALRVYTTYYIPCIPGTTICYYGTASGTLVHKGSIAMVYPWYLLFAGERLYVPGYGFGVVEDNNGDYTNAFGETYWLDLGYAQTDAVDWTNRWVTVYFLTPVPANVAATYILP